MWQQWRKEKCRLERRCGIKNVPFLGFSVRSWNETESTDFFEKRIYFPKNKNQKSETKTKTLRSAGSVVGVWDSRTVQKQTYYFQCYGYAGIYQAIQNNLFLIANTRDSRFYYLKQLFPKKKCQARDDKSGENLII